jgi:hypothetical protein
VTVNIRERGGRTVGNVLRAINRYRLREKSLSIRERGGRSTGGALRAINRFRIRDKTFAIREKGGRSTGGALRAINRYRIRNKVFAIIERGGRSTGAALRAINRYRIRNKVFAIIEKGGRSTGAALRAINRYKLQTKILHIREKGGRTVGNVLRAIRNFRLPTKIQNFRERGAGAVMAAYRRLRNLPDITVYVNYKQRGRRRAEGGPVFANDGLEGFAEGGITGLGNAGRTTPASAGRTVGGSYRRPTILEGERQRTDYVIATNPAYRRQNLSYLRMAAHELGIPGFAEGSAMVTKGTRTAGPQFLVGEENRKEFVLSTNPTYRARNLNLWSQAANELGMPGFKTGGPVGPPPHRWTYYANGGASLDYVQGKTEAAKEYMQEHRGNKYGAHGRRAREHWRLWNRALAGAKKWDERFTRMTNRAENLGTLMTSPWQSEEDFRRTRRQRVGQLDGIINALMRGVKDARRREDWNRVRELEGQIAQYKIERAETRHAERQRPDLRALLTDSERARIDAIQADIALGEAGQQPRFGRIYGGGDPATQAMLFWTRLLGDRRFRHDPQFISEIAANVAQYRGQVVPANVAQAAVDTARGDLYREFGSNVRYLAGASPGQIIGESYHRNPVVAASVATGQVMNAAASYAPSWASSLISGGGAAGSHASKVMNQNNYYTTAPKDPHTFAADTKYEFEAM